ncbi:PREDICTED: dolichol-phosphate mannosyltransferase subunit 3-like [Rhagoletis zephyria]|uniref:dolichol-phosphate mannosyltransferase subunit 3-like n=1 Tax=Rhagoletis zephyria TaxID=28612 RepID=UPI00081127E5|nr:PREDICTED: dolichol-phosphate mannosyltransferase subunit 3-like [Rhagoletis zephyria]
MTMTNLQRWLLYIGVFAIPYLAIVAGYLRAPVLTKWELEIQLLPIVLLVLLGAYAATVVLYRTFTFNDCPQAAKELQQQIEEARKDLKEKGFVFHD